MEIEYSFFSLIRLLLISGRQQQVIKCCGIFISEPYSTCWFTLLVILAWGYVCNDNSLMYLPVLELSHEVLFLGHSNTPSNGVVNLLSCST